MARRKLSDFYLPGTAALPAAEEILRRAAIDGETAVVGTGKRPEFRAAPGEGAAAAPPQRLEDALATDPQAVRADFIRYLALGGCEDCPLHERGVRLRGARILGRLNLEACRLETPLRLNQCSLDDGLALRDAETRALHLGGTRILAPKPGGVALSADRLRCRGDLSLQHGFYSQGEARLNGAEIDGGLFLNGGRFETTGEVALNLRSLRLKGDALLINGFWATGAVLMTNAHISGDIRLNGGRFESGAFDVSLRMTGMRLDGVLIMREPPRNRDGVQAMFDGRLILTAARLRSIVDGPECWPPAGSLSLEGCVYERIGRSGPTDAQTRRRWLLRQTETDLQKEFKPQPWEHLESVLRAQGHSREARLIGVYKERQRRRAGAVPRLARPLHRLYGATVGYGYFTARALLWGLLFIAVGAVLFGEAWRAGAMAPSHEALLDDPVWLDCAGAAPNPAECWRARLPGRDYENFNAALYSFDVFLPVVALEQEAAWSPSSTRGWRIGEILRGAPAGDAVLALPVIGPWLADLRLGAIAWAYRILHEVLGYLLSAFAIAGAARLVRDA